MTALLNVEFEDENGVTRKLTRKEVLHYTQVVAGAGNETTGRLIGWLAKVLAEHPDQRREVARGPVAADPRGRRDPAVRADRARTSPDTWHRDFECYGTTVPAGSAMLLLFGAANRDPRRYTDPDTFDIHRDNISHLTFGKGLHYCLGANLARLEGRVALDELLNRWPEWGHRLRDSTARADIDRPRLGTAAACAALTDRRNCPECVSNCTTSSCGAIRPQTFIGFLTDVVGMEVQFQLRVPGEVLETTLGWPPSDGADLTMLGSGDAGLIEVLDVPEHLRDVAPEGLAALSFLTDDFSGATTRRGHSQLTSPSSTAGCPASSCSSAPWAVCRSSSWAAMPQRRIRKPATRRTLECAAAMRCVRPRPLRAGRPGRRDR